MELNETIAGLRPMLRRLIRADVEMLTALSPEAGHIRADRGQIEQVVVNLAVNAGDAMPDGGTLTIATSNVELDEDYFRVHPAGTGEPGRYTLLEVQDTGVGIDEETLAHVFAILEAAEGDAALALSDTRAPGSLDLLVTDTVVPGPGGSALADRIRRRHPALRAVIMSGYSEALATGDVPLQSGTEFIAKPFGPADLNAKLRSLLCD